MDIDEIRRAFLEGRFDLSEHAITALQDDALFDEDLRNAAASYIHVVTEDDERGTKWVLEGRCGREILVRLVVTWDEDRVFVVTVYVRGNKRRTRRGSG